MTRELESWERRHYVDGGGEPLLFYVVFGEINVTATCSRSEYRTNGCPPGVNVAAYGPDNSPDVPASFCEGYLWDHLVSNDPELAKSVSDCQHCLVMRGAPENAATLDYLRDAVGLLTFLLDNGGCAIYDPFMLRWWSPADWREQVFAPGTGALARHTVILMSPEDDPAFTWVHTRGMRKFGRPDISVRGVAEENRDGVIALCNRLIEHQTFGHVVPDGQEVKMSPLPNGGVIRHAGTLDDPDFNNVHLDITWPDTV